MSAAASGQIVDDFENSFQACLAALTNPDYFNVRDSEEVKTGVEQTIQRFLDVAKQMECFFLQKRLLLSVQKPEHIVSENINELKNELERKDQLLKKYYEKVVIWQNLLKDVPNVPGPTRAPMPPPHPGPPPPPQQQQQPPPGLGMVPGPPPANMPPQQPGPQSHPHHMMPPHCMPQPPMTSSMSGGMVLPTSQMHPHMGQNQPGPGVLQGPLASLERTMSNIGMPNGR